MSDFFAYDKGYDYGKWWAGSNRTFFNLSEIRAIREAVKRWRDDDRTELALLKLFDEGGGIWEKCRRYFSVDEKGRGAINKAFLIGFLAGAGETLHETPFNAGYYDAEEELCFLRNVDHFVDVASFVDSHDMSDPATDKLLTKKIADGIEERQTHVISRRN